MHRQSSVEAEGIIGRVISPDQPYRSVRSNAPTTHEGLERGEISIEPIGPTQWEATVQYSPPGAELEEGESSYSFNTGGETQHITHSKSTVGSYAPADETAPDYDGAIGATKDNVEGVDITVPVYRFSETHIKGDSDVANAYKGSGCRRPACGRSGRRPPSRTWCGRSCQRLGESSGGNATTSTAPPSPMRTWA